MCSNVSTDVWVCHADHAKSLVTVVKEAGEQRSTMLQLVDLWRSQTRKSG